MTCLVQIQQPTLGLCNSYRARFCARSRASGTAIERFPIVRVTALLVSRTFGGR